MHACVPRARKKRKKRKKREKRNSSAKPTGCRRAYLKANATVCCPVSPSAPTLRALTLAERGIWVSEHHIRMHGDRPANLWLASRFS